MSQELYAEAMLGRDAEEFWRSELGRVILGRIKQDKELLLLELATVSPWRRRKIQLLQSQIWRIDTIQQWFSELIVQGRQAERVLNDAEKE